MYTKDLVPFFLLLNRYYARMLTRISPSEWAAITAYRDYVRTQDSDIDSKRETEQDHTSSDLPQACGKQIEQAIERIARASEEDAIELEYEFNRLFVGPDKPQAAPYETVYVSSERVLMRHHTLEVRKAYRQQGFEVQALNTEPDDHAAYECAFAAALLERQDENSKVAFEDFMEKHLTRWVGAHTAEIRANTANEICIGFADLFDAAVAAASA